MTCELSTHRETDEVVASLVTARTFLGDGDAVQTLSQSRQSRSFPDLLCPVDELSYTVYRILEYLGEKFNTWRRQSSILHKL